MLVQRFHESVTMFGFLTRCNGFGVSQDDLRCPMSTATKSKSYSRRKAGVLLLVGVLAGVTIGGGVGVLAASSTKSVTVCANKKNKCVALCQEW
jgi:hypothetical protein